MLRSSMQYPGGGKLWISPHEVALVGGSSVLFYLANPWAKLGVGVILISLIVFLLRLPTTRR